MKKLEDIVSLAKRRGFVFPTSEIYGGLTSSYDYGPLGVELLNNIKHLWWQEFIQKRDDMVGIDSQIMLHPKTWVASGHVASFSDPMVEDKVTHKRYRADHVIEAWMKKQDKSDLPIVEDMTIDQMDAFISERKIVSPDGNELTSPKNFNLLFETQLGVVVGEKSSIYLRGETAQGIFSNFKNVLDSTRVKLPFGIGQIGKSFRNEITSGQFVFRTLEFEQAEIEYFFDPQSADWEELFKSWQDAMWDFVVKTLGVTQEKLRWRKHTDTERSHYSRDTYDLEYEFPFGWKELWGVAYRTDYDLKQHMEHSGVDLAYKDPVSGKTFMPHVIEPAVGINRLFLMLLVDAFERDEKRIVLQLNPRLAPKTVAVFPLVANKDDIAAKAREVYQVLVAHGVKTSWDERGNIGKRYLSQDEAGTPWCITIDYDTLKDESVTIRDRDTTKQERVHLEKLVDHISKLLLQ